MCRAPLKISLLSGLPVEILQLQLQLQDGTRSCTHTRKTIPLAPIHSFTKQIIPSMYEESLT